MVFHPSREKVPMTQNILLQKLQQVMMAKRLTDGLYL